MAQLRVVCLPHAGGSASFFRRWAAELPTSVELLAVQYPGREERLNEPMYQHMADLVGALTFALAAHPGLRHTPYVLFGHSMGGAVAYELSRQLRREGLPQPAHLLLSACESPARHQGGRLHHQADAALLAEITRLGSSQLDWAAHPELAQLVLPAMRNDYQVIETWQADPLHPQLDIPIDVLVGSDDPELSEADAQDWLRYTSRSFRLSRYPGAHFYLIAQQAAVCAHINRVLALVGFGTGSHFP
ncbi:thioesterase II family protein [Aquaspirillum sp. LM1]|uniref:thioesterase II family protein n=1 Tax=Aquaspirillum sp. LM1 TaxID=1938604 RepID=UPI001558835E|nr:alpha/beta fold hydrolase [Aquaspirillum sp. LM1]